MSVNVALVTGGWGQNIGNAFFNVAGKWLLEQAVPNGRVEWIQDQPGYRTFHNQSAGNPKSHIDLLGSLEVDVLVLQGPLLTSSLRALWQPSLDRLKRRGTKFVILSGGLFKYTEEEIKDARSFLQEYPPDIFTSRDSVTYSHFGDICELTYDGIESAFCIPDAFQPFSLSMPPRIALCFDRYPEPNFKVTDQSSGGGDTSGNLSGDFLFDNARWSWTIPSLQQKLSGIGQRAAYMSALSDRRKLPPEIGGYLVLRPEHRTNPFIGWKVYKNPGAVAWDDPFTYLTVYANSSLTLSDRVHACVVAAAYGKPTMLFGSTPRSSLFARMGIENVHSGPAILPEERRVAERDALLEFLRRSFSSILEN